MIQKRSQKAKNAAIKKERDSLPRAKKGYTTSKGIIGETLQTLINTPEIEFFEPTEQEITRNEAGEYPFDKRSKITKETVETPKKRNLKGGEEDSMQYQEAEEEVELLLEKYLQHMHNKGAQADNPDADPDSEISAALVHYSKETAHPRAKEHIAKTLRFIQEAPQNNKNHGLPDKSWLYEHQEVRGLKGQTHLKKYGFYQTFSRRGLAGDGFLKDLTEQEGGLEKDLYEYLTSNDPNGSIYGNGEDILNRRRQAKERLYCGMGQFRIEGRYACSVTLSLEARKDPLAFRKLVLETITRKPISAEDIGHERLGSQFLRATNLAWAGAKRLFAVEEMIDKSNQEFKKREKELAQQNDLLRCQRDEARRAVRALISAHVRGTPGVSQDDQKDPLEVLLSWVENPGNDVDRQDEDVSG
ncbi:hypothetical protein GMDG_08650 [Pseudogymnoascus destructans 20631-21]|uniref:Uncharacterized protein n=1 Tax=Pseudogymnoascus destructans (strain ATCC MYA-4855 / 20631-21) TaxID=658429 RepID=L8G6B6_PSED2|nr:hypothetical protein GMDG_08650 [Pseudogymnoascus destructans 20631-21]